MAYLLFDIETTENNSLQTKTLISIKLAQHKATEKCRLKSCGFLDVCVCVCCLLSIKATIKWQAVMFIQRMSQTKTDMSTRVKQGHKLDE